MARQHRMVAILGTATYRRQARTHAYPATQHWVTARQRWSSPIAAATALCGAGYSQQVRGEDAEITCPACQNALEHDATIVTVLS